MPYRFNKQLTITLKCIFILHRSFVCWTETLKSFAVKNNNNKKNNNNHTSHCEVYSQYFNFLYLSYFSSVGILTKIYNSAKRNIPFSHAALPQAVTGPFSQRLPMLAVLYLNHSSNLWENVHVESNKILQPFRLWKNWKKQHIEETTREYSCKINKSIRDNQGVVSITENPSSLWDPFLSSLSPKCGHLCKLQQVSVCRNKNANLH